MEAWSHETNGQYGRNPSNPRFSVLERKDAMRKYAVSIVVGMLLAGGRAIAADDVIANVRSACQKELNTVCKGVPEGEGRVLACFYAFQDKLSDKCVYALYDGASQLERAATALKFAASQCKDDFQKFCSDVKLGQGKGLACLKKNEKSVSQTCNDALKQTGLKK